MGIETAIIIGAGLAAASAGGQAYQAHEARGEFRDERKEQDAVQRKLESDEKKRQEAALASTPMIADQARNRQRALAARNSGDMANQRTGPGGLLGNAPGTKPTLLGL